MIHLVLNGAYRLTNAKLTACLQGIHKRCPSLLRYLTTPGTCLERALDSNVDSQGIQADHEHANPAAQIRVYPKSLELLNDPLLSVKTLHNLHNKHPFLSLLRKAYRRCLRWLPWYLAVVPYIWSYAAVFYAVALFTVNYIYIMLVASSNNNPVQSFNSS